jgi:AcrR family transcriptional regulator
MVRILSLHINVQRIYDAAGKPVKFAVHSCAMNRRYELKERARRQAQTRQRIVEAAVDLHTSVGPARTTISAIAQRAGVERHTVYAHFPDDRSLFSACSAHWTATHPLPDPEKLVQIADPEQRLRRALGELYAWYESVEDDVALFFRDATVVPATAEALARTTADLASLADVAARGRPRRKPVRAAIGHAFEFETWRSLVRRQGLSRAQAVDAMARLVASV